MASPNFLRHSRWLALALAAILVLTALAVEGLEVKGAVAELQSGVSLLARARQTLGENPQGWDAARVEQAADLQRRAQPLLEHSCARLGRDLALRSASRLPNVGPQARAIDDLCQAAVAAGAAFADFDQVAGAYIRQPADGAPPGPRLLALLASAQGPLSDADARLRPALARLESDLRLALSPPLAGRVAAAVRELRAAENQASAWLQSARFLPAAIGAAAPTTYLVLLENPSELRPSGGLIGAVGTATFAQGAPTNVDIRDYDALNALFKQRFPVPSPLDRYLTFYANSLELGDAGWDPDFPTTARLAEAMYVSAVPTDLQGTISIDPYAVSALLAVTGPVTVPGYGSFTAEDFFPRLNAIVNANDNSAVGKRVLPGVAQEVLKQVLSQPVSAWPALLRVIVEQASGRHIQISLHDAAPQRALAAAGFDGSLLSPPADDYLLLVDANVGGTKGDWYTRKQMTLRSEVYPNGLVRHELDLRYQLPDPVDDTDRLLNPGDGSYRDYVRVYLPQEATVAAFQYQLDGKLMSTALDRVGVEHGKRVVGAFFALPRGHEAELRLTYEVPVSHLREYSLYVQKQAGVAELPTSLIVSYPGGLDQRRLSLRQDQTVSYRW